ncbi:MAG: acetyl-CoA carboxylase biotin carboxyl carrier protein subunit [Bacteroidales bacterium]|nr:acetyl-CoA carboxylase biotin carboxyl carrier protein subunit [Bacteroidales bacterium]
MSDEPELYNAHIQVFAEGRKYKTQLTKKFMERKKWVAPNPKIIVSHIPGVVKEIMASDGQKVKKGQKLMIYEAMKMKNIVNAPFDGIIQKIEVKEGDKLHKGDTLIVME